MPRTEAPDAEVHVPDTKHTRTVILLHGRDSTAREFMSELFESQASDGRTFPQLFPSTKWVFPAASMLPSARFGSVLSQWFDMHTTEDPHERQEQQDFSVSVARIQEIISGETAKVGPNNIVLGGISQGCAVAIRVLLEGNLRLGGFIGLCGWIPQPNTLESVIIDAAVKTPALVCHAQDDEVIGIRFGEELRETLVGLQMEVYWHSYVDGGHWLNEPQGVDDVVSFLERVGMGSS